MDPTEYDSFNDALVDRLRVESDVIGVVVLGSTADPDRADRYSDHDFFVITRTGEQERYRADLSWLPNAERIAFSLRETEHGLKAVYDDGHIAEFAVFEPEELGVARANSYRVLFDREDVTSRMERVAERTDVNDHDSEYLLGMFCANIITGVNRYARGERLSGDRFVKTHALEHLLELIERHVEPTGPDLRDDLDPTRRFEQRYPDIAMELEPAQDAPVPRSARILCRTLERVIGARTEPYLTVVRGVLDRP